MRVGIWYTLKRGMQRETGNYIKRCMRENGLFSMMRCAQQITKMIKNISLISILKGVERDAERSK